MKTIDGVTYYAKAKKQATGFYPVIEFVGNKIGSQIYWLNEPQETRSKALAVAKKYIKNIKV